VVKEYHTHPRDSRRDQDKEYSRRGGGPGGGRDYCVARTCKMPAQLVKGSDLCVSFHSALMHCGYGVVARGHVYAAHERVSQPQDSFLEILVGRTASCLWRV